MLENWTSLKTTSREGVEKEKFGVQQRGKIAT